MKTARRAKQLGLRSLAAEIGVSAALLSQIELGHAQPSVSALYALVGHPDLLLDGALDCSLRGRSCRLAALASTDGALALAARVGLDDSEQSPIIRSARQHPTIRLSNGVTWELVSTVFGSEPGAVLAIYQPGASSSADGSLMIHPGHEEAFLIEGE